MKRKIKISFCCLCIQIACMTVQAFCVGYAAAIGKLTGLIFSCAAIVLIILITTMHKAWSTVNDCLSFENDLNQIAFQIGVIAAGHQYPAYPCGESFPSREAEHTDPAPED